jgi:hypothetical protein
MSDLTNTEKRQLEKLLGMGGGYVLDFSNRTFDEFVIDSVGINIYDAKYADGGESKANRLRTLWRKESNYTVGKLTSDLLEFCETAASWSGDAAALPACRLIAKRLSASSPVDVLDAITAAGLPADFELLAQEVRDAIGKNKPEAGLDRLHAFVTTFLRTMAAMRGIAPDKGKPLHSIFGEYVKALRAAMLIESEMAERILKSTISTLEAFNAVRNDSSLAHPNPTLCHEEALLIFNNVCNVVRFIKAIEASANVRDQS